MKNEALAQAFRTYAINEFVVSVTEEFKKQYDAIMEGAYHGELTQDCSAARLIGSCKRIAREFVYSSDEILRIELMGRNVIQDLLSLFWEGAAVCDASSTFRRFPSSVEAVGGPSG